MAEIISSLQNPKVKRAVALYDRRDRDRENAYLIEGFREVTRAAQGGVAFQTLFTCAEFFLGTNEEALIDQIQQRGAEIVSCTSSVFQKLSYRDRPDGLLAVATQERRTLTHLPESPTFLLIAQGIEKPGNLGTILRSADAAGVDGVIVCDRCTDIFNPNVVRASVGTLFTVPVVEATTEETLSWLKAKGIKSVAATPHTEYHYTEADFSERIAIVVGREQLGLSEEWLSHADIRVRIPMLGVADSLNVASATTLLLYEVVRQRNFACK